MPVPEGLAVGDTALGSNMAADLVIQDSTSEEAEIPSLFKAEIINYPNSDARDPIIASSDNNINIIFTISKEKFRRMALAVLDHCEKDNPGKNHEEFSQTSSDLATDPLVLTSAGNSKSREVCDTMCEKTTQSIEYSSKERVVEKDPVYEHVSSSENIRCMNTETSLTFNEEKNMAETGSKCHELELDWKETSNISFSNERNETISSNSENDKDILQVSCNSPLKEYFSEDPDGVKKHRGIVDCQSVEKDISCQNESEIQIDCKSSLQKTESKRIESNCTDKTVIDKLNVDENISISQEFTLNEFSDMFPTMKTEEIEILKIESNEGTDTFTKYFKLDLTNQFVVLKIRTVDENFLMNAYKFKEISTDSVTHANTSTEDFRFSSQCIREISSNFSNEKPIVPKADSPKTSDNLVAAINSEKVAENEENFSPSNNEEILYDKNTVMDTSNISVANEDGDLENQSTCSNETNKLIEQSLDLERSQELDQKELIECTNITQPDEFSELRPGVDSAKLLDLKANTDTPDVKNIGKDAESSVNDSRLECSFSIKQCLKAKSMENKPTESASYEEIGALNTSDNLCMNFAISDADSKKEILSSSKEFVDFENNLGKMDMNTSSTQEKEFVEDLYICKDRGDNSDSLNVTSENLEIEQTDSAENTSLIVTSNLEPKSEVREQSFTLSFSEFADEKSLKKSENEKADFTKPVEDNLEILSEEMVSEEINETVEHPENIGKYSEDCLNADETFIIPKIEITTAHYTETSSEIIIAKKEDSPELTAEKLIESSIETDSGASDSNPEDGSLVNSECSGTKAENIIGAGKCEAMDEGIEALQSSKNELKEQLADDVAERIEEESCEGADIDLKKESIEETEDANETKSSIDVYENEAETYEITKCEPQNEIIESDTNTKCFEKDMEKTDTLVIAEDIESVEKLGLESSRVETKESTMNSEFDDSDLIDKEETLHSKKADLSLDVSAIEVKTELEIAEEPESAADEYATDSETTSERDALDIEEVKSVVSESDDSRDSESSRLDRNSKKHKSDEVDCAPTRTRMKKSKFSEDVIPENSAVSKSSRSLIKVSKSKSTSKVSPIERSLRSRSLEPVAEPSKATISKTDPALTNRKRASTPEVIGKKDIKTAVRSSPRKFTRAASVTADTSKTPKNINRSNTDVPTTLNASSSGASAPKKRTAKRSGTDK